MLLLLLMMMMMIHLLLIISRSGMRQLPRLFSELLSQHREGTAKARGATEWQKLTGRFLCRLLLLNHEEIGPTVNKNKARFHFRESYTSEERIYAPRAYRGFGPNSLPFAVSEIASRRWWWITSLFPTIRSKIETLSS